MSLLAGCGGKTLHAPDLNLGDAAAFRVNVMPETYNLGGSTGKVFVTVDQAPQSNDTLMVVNVNVDNAKDLKSLYIALEYDHLKYRLMSAEPTALMGGADNLLSLSVPAGQGTVEYGQVLVQPDTQGGLTGSGVAALFTFSLQPELVSRAISNAGPPVTAASQVIDLAYSGGNVTWSYVQRGDYDQNGETNISDLTPLGVHFGEGTGAGPFDFATAQSVIDGDSNGEINISDITPIGANFKRDTSGGFHVYSSSNVGDYPAGDPPTGANGSGTAEHTAAPSAPVEVTDAVNYAQRNTERLRFSFTVSAPVVDEFYWVRPADAEGVLGIASNLSNGSPAGTPELSLDPAATSGGSGTQADPFILLDTVDYSFRLLDAPGGADVTTDPGTMFTVTPAAAGTFTGHILDVTTDYNGDFTVTATYNGVPNSASSDVYCRTSFVVLGTIAPFGSFGGGSGMTNQGIFTVVNGDIGTTGVSTMITGFHDSDGDVYTETPLNIGQVNGQIYTAPPAPGTAEQLAVATQGAIDAQNAYDSMSPASLPGGTDPGAGQLGGLTLPAGVYQSAGGTFQITGSDLTLDGGGDPNAVWVFQAASSLTVGDVVPRSVNLINGAQAGNVYWYVGSAATINSAGGGTMVGTIIASAGVTFSTAGNVLVTTLEGRAIGLNASVTLVNTHINIP